MLRASTSHGCTCCCLRDVCSGGLRVGGLPLRTARSRQTTRMMTTVLSQGQVPAGRQQAPPPVMTRVSPPRTSTMTRQLPRRLRRLGGRTRSQRQATTALRSPRRRRRTTLPAVRLVLPVTEGAEAPTRGRPSWQPSLARPAAARAVAAQAQGTRDLVVQLTRGRACLPPLRPRATALQTAAGRASRRPGERALLPVAIRGQAC